MELVLFPVIPFVCVSISFLCIHGDAKVSLREALDQAGKSRWTGQGKSGQVTVASSAVTCRSSTHLWTEPLAQVPSRAEKQQATA